MQYRVGIGYDIHLLAEGRKLFIGGVEIPYIKGLLGHSDADVLIHAICDAILGAAGEQNDIGQLFPNTDPKYDGISSVKLLEAVADLIRGKNFTVNNIDTVVIAQEPILAPFKKLMCQKIAKILEIDEDRVGIKAKTNEGVGEIGKKEAIASYAVVTLVNKE